jgi:hypothetical protein
MRSIALLGLGILLIAAPNANRDHAKIKRGRTHTTVDLRARGTEVAVRGAKIEASIHLSQKCHAEKLAQTIAEEVRQNPDAFRMGRMRPIDLWPSSLPGDPGNRGEGKRGGTNSKSDMAGFESVFADILATGQHGSGGRSGGETCFNGLNLDLSALIAANTGPIPPDASVANNRDGSTTSTSTNGGIKTNWIQKQGHLTATSSGSALGGDAYSQGGSVSFTQSGSKDSSLLAHELTHATQQGSGTSSTEVTFEKDGGTTTAQTKSGKSGATEVEVKTTETHDSNGKKTSGTVEVKVNGKKVSEQDSGGDEGKTGKGRGGGGTGGGASPTLTAEGTFQMPPMCIPDAMVAQLINWNRLAEAVTDPNPMDDPEETPTGGGGINGLDNSNGPCGQTEESSFDPNPAYLRKQKGGGVTDPVRFLRSDRRQRR